MLGGVVLAGYEPPSLDFKRFQLAGSDIVVTTYWPEGDSGTRPVQIRAFETNSGGRLFGKEYPKVTSKDLPEVADRFCADLLEALTGNGSFFRSTLAFVKKTGKMSANVWLVKPTGRDLRQITNMPGESMSPAWSPDGRFVVFTHIDEKSHALGRITSYNVCYTKLLRASPRKRVRWRSTGSTSVAMRRTDTALSTIAPSEAGRECC